MMSSFISNRQKFLAFAFVLAILDQAFKILALKFLERGVDYPIIPNFITLRLLMNKGVSFGLGSQTPDQWRVPVLVGVTLVILVGTLFFALKQFNDLNTWERAAFALIVGGALGNFYDRLFRPGVVDYMFFHFFEFGFFVNNFADDIISIGFALFIIGSYTGKNGTTKT